MTDKPDVRRTLDGNGVYNQSPEHPQGTLVLVLGIVGFFVTVCAPIAWYLGSKTQKEIATSGQNYANEANIGVGKILGMVVTIVAGVGLVAAVAVTVFSLVAGGALFAGLAAGAGGGGIASRAPSSEAQNQPGGSISIGIKFNQPGIGMKEGEDFSGFDVEVARYVATQLGYSRVDFVDAQSAYRETMLQSGQVEMIFATYSITDDRAKKVAFAGPYVIAGQDLLVRTADTDVAGPASLNGKKLCSVTGSTAAKKVQERFAGGVQLVEQDSYAACVEALSSGLIDAVTTDDLILAGFAAQARYSGKLRVVGQPFSEERYGVGIQRGDAELCHRINAALEKMVHDGAWDRAVEGTVGRSGFKPGRMNPPEPAVCAS